MNFLNKRNPFIYGFVVSLVAFLISLLQPSAAPATVAVAFDTAGGTPVEIVTLPGGGKLSSLPTTSKSGYTFEHWLKGSEEVTLNTVFNTNTTVRAVFDVIEFTIVYQTNGGNVIEPETVAFGDEIRLPIPTKVGSVFQGWYEESAFTNLVPEALEVNQDYVLYAKWSVVGVDVVSVSYFSEGLGLIESTYVSPNTTITLITPPEREGYSFTNWINGLTFSPVSTNTYLVTQDIVFFADWVSIGGLVTITFDSQGGTAVPSMQVPVGSQWQNPQEVPFLAEGYQFLTWITNCNFDGFEVSCTTLDENYIVTDDMTVLARYDYMVPLASMRFDSYERNGRVIGYVLASIEDFSPENTISTLVLPARFSGVPVVAIGEYVFESVDYLDKVIIPENIQYIQNNAFANSSIKEVFLPSSLIEIGYESFSGSDLEQIHLADNPSIRFIREAAFRETQIQDFYAPSTLTYLGGNAFNTTPLQSVTFDTPTKLAYIGDSAFRNTALTNVTLPEGIRTIDGSAFADNNLLTTIHIPATVDWMDNEVFANSPIETITFGANSRLRIVGENLFGDDPFIVPFVEATEGDFALAGPILVAYKGNRTDGEALVIPDTVRLISDSVFDVFNPLAKSSLTLPTNLKFVGYNAFFGANIGGPLTIPDDVYVTNQAFMYTTFVGDITIGEVTKLDYRAFANVTAEDVILEDNPRADQDTFGGQIFEYANIQSITMGEGYKNIPYGFSQYSQVVHLQFPDSIRYMDSNVIGSQNLETVTFIGTSLLYGVNSYVISSEVMNSPWYQNAKPYIVLKNNLVRLDNSSLTNGASITIPNGVKMISNDVMYGWIDYASFDFNDVAYIRDSAFYRWNLNLTINQPTTIDNVSYFGSTFSRNFVELITNGTINPFNNFEIDVDYLMNEDRNVPTSLSEIVEFNNQGFKIIGNVLFKYDPNFDLTPEEVTVPSQVEIITSYSFQNVVLPENFTLNEGLRLIEDSAFYEAQFFEGNLTLPSTVEYVRNYGFGYTNLIDITIPASVKLIGYNAFYASTLRSVEFEDLTNLRMEREAFGNIESRTRDLSPLYKNYLDNQMVIIDGLLVGYFGYEKEVVVPEGVVSILRNAFSNRDSFIQSISLPSTLTYIHSYAFASLENLTSIDFSNVAALRYVGTAVFEFTSLQSVTIDAPIQEISPYALEDMPSLLDYDLNLVNPTYLFISYGVDLMD